MDARTTMIIAKGKFVTTDVADCIYHKENHKWEMRTNKVIEWTEFFLQPAECPLLEEPTEFGPPKISSVP